MKLSEHFTSEEFACKCGCGFNMVDPELIAVLEDVRSFFGVPVHINSGCRCKKHNEKEGGAKDSKHTYGLAADIVVKDTLPEKVYVYLDNKYPKKYGLGLYKTWTHVDVRTVRWRKIYATP